MYLHFYIKMFGINPEKKWNAESSESQTFWFFSLHIPASFTKMCDDFPSCVKRNAIIDIFVVWLLHYRTEWILCLHDLWPTLWLTDTAWIPFGQTICDPLPQILLWQVQLWHDVFAVLNAARLSTDFELPFASVTLHLDVFLIQN